MVMKIDPYGASMIKSQQVFHFKIKRKYSTFWKNPFFRTYLEHTWAESQLRSFCFAFGVFILSWYFDCVSLICCSKHILSTILVTNVTNLARFVLLTFLFKTLFLLLKCILSINSLLPGPSRRLAPVLECRRSVFSTLHC